MTTQATPLPLHHPTLPTELLLPILHHALHSTYTSSPSSTTPLASLILRLSSVSTTCLSALSRDSSLIDPISASLHTRWTTASAALRALQKDGRARWTMDVATRVALDEERDRWEAEREVAWRGICEVAKVRGKLRVLMVGVERRWAAEDRAGERERERERARQLEKDSREVIEEQTTSGAAWSQEMDATGMSAVRVVEGIMV